MPPPSGKRILVVEDQHDVARVILLFLVQHGYVVEVARSGSEALVLVDSFGPDVLLLDLHLPDFRGEDVARIARGRRSPLRIVGMTGGSVAAPTPEERQFFDELLAKPSGLDELLRAL